MVHNHSEAVLLKESIKLNIAMSEKAECILSGAKDKEVIYSLIDNLWHLINRSRLTSGNLDHTDMYGYVGYLWISMDILDIYGPPEEHIRLAVLD
jgi:hypothetical protein